MKERKKGEGFLDWGRIWGKINYGILGEFAVAGVVFLIFQLLGVDHYNKALAYISALVLVMFMHKRQVGYWHIVAVLYWLFSLSKMSVFASYHDAPDNETWISRVVSSVILSLVTTEIINKAVDFIRDNKVCPRKGQEENKKDPLT